MKWILGNQIDDACKYEKNLFYCCYRHNFEQMESFTDDVGWGCTLRSAQMLIGNVLLKNRLDAVPLVKDKSTSMLSIHNLVRKGGVYGLSPGNWFYPSIACKALRDVWKGSDMEHVFTISVYGQDSLDTIPTLMILPVKLGVDKIDEKYQELIANMLKDPCSMGLVGGSGTSSYYYIGIDDKNKALYLDPHDLRDARDTDYSAKKIHTASLSSLDPSLSFAFFVKSEAEKKRIVEQYKDVFGTVYLEGDDEKKFVCMDDDDFCVILEEE